jgi:hypothetical protein
MCYEFVHACENQLINRVTKLCVNGNCFLICMGNLNYFYCNDRDLVRTAKKFLSEKGIVLHSLSESEMLSVINFPNTKEFQTFHGSLELFFMFREKLEAA